MSATAAPSAQAMRSPSPVFSVTLILTASTHLGANVLSSSLLRAKPPVVSTTARRALTVISLPRKSVLDAEGGLQVGAREEEASAGPHRRSAEVGALLEQAHRRARLRRGKRGGNAGETGANDNDIHVL
jgi:hypothetical protein